MSANSEYPEPLRILIRAFSRLPGIGRRTAERLTLSLLDWPEDQLREFGERLSGLPTAVGYCEKCGNLSDQQLCAICRDPGREPELICVVESPVQIMVIERAGCFRGLYHVLGGRLAPLDGQGPEDLNIEKLLQRLDAESVGELILATGADVEGEATANYLREIAQRPDLRISRIAFGIPVGGDIGFADSATVAMAISSRHCDQ